ncbi:type I toxin-antitoxin system SymE family toxin [Pantoea anthophila]|uniref:hypothetical protein n=1 Tax=Pantoea anthophila TaxID=470931 RepID=UPI002DB5CC32|nr:hypothetical protein [Pantoea anthophila]MEB7540147.1 type I toxin-antitoxin system SymE family toxin [Pantoea anthophila]
MNITFVKESVPELTITGCQLAALGFTTDTPIRLMLRNNALSVTTVTDEAEWGERRDDYRRQLAERFRYY